jgi:hypothetical protein
MAFAIQPGYSTMSPFMPPSMGMTPMAPTPGLNSFADPVQLSPDMMGNPNADLSSMLGGLAGNFQPPNPVEQLQQKIAETQMQLQMAQQMGDQPAVEQLGQQLQMLMAQLQQLTGGGDPNQAAGGDPSQAGGIPGGGASGGGSPGGGMDAGGGSPGGGSPGGGMPMGGGSPSGGGAPMSAGGPSGGGAPMGAGPSSGPRGGRSGDGMGVADTSNVQLSGQGQGVDAVKWALTQDGISESRNPNVVRGYSRGAWQAWCADFVSTAYKNTGGSPFGHQSSVQGILDWGRRNDRFLPAGSARGNPGQLAVGDVVVWKQNGRSHVGLLTGVNQNGTFNTIEGNTINRVARRTHSFGSNQLTGFVRPRGDNFGSRPSNSTPRQSTPRQSSPAPRQATSNRRT